MRRLALLVFSASGFAALCACSGGTAFYGGGSDTTPASAVVFSTSATQANAFFVTPTGVSPLQVSAESTSSSSNIIAGRTYTWSAGYLGKTSTYSTGSPAFNQPTGFKACPAIPASLPPIPILVQGGTGAASSYIGYSVLPAGGTSQTVFVGAVPGQTATSYCIELVATDTTSGRLGSVNIFVGNSP